MARLACCEAPKPSSQPLACAEICAGSLTPVWAILREALRSRTARIGFMKLNMMAIASAWSATATACG